MYKMKNVFKFFAVIIIATSCNGKSSSPNEVFTSFASAMQKKDFATAKKFATIESLPVLTVFETKMTNSKTNFTDKFDTSFVSFEEAIITGDNAVLPLKEKKSGAIIRFPLKKEGGNWKVAFDIDNLTDLAMGSLEENKDKLKGINADSLLNEMKHMNFDSLEREFKKMSMDSLGIKM
jgi:Domain of unknown function (DUF4878)